MSAQVLVLSRALDDAFLQTPSSCKALHPRSALRTYHTLCRVWISKSEKYCIHCSNLMKAVFQGAAIPSPWAPPPPSPDFFIPQTSPAPTCLAFPPNPIPNPDLFCPNPDSPGCCKRLSNSVHDLLCTVFVILSWSVPWRSPSHGLPRNSSSFQEKGHVHGHTSSRR